MISPGSLAFHWPAMLWLLALVPALVALYLWLPARAHHASLAYPGLRLAAEARGRSTALLRHGPALLLLAGVTVLLLAVARPHAALSLPARQETVILAMDVSGSMRATDLKPNRLAAAQQAAKEFIARQPRHVRVGIVAIAGAAAVVQSPTESREELFQALDRFQLQRGSAIGSGLVISLATLLPDAGIEVDQLAERRSRRAWLDERKRSQTAKAVAPGSNRSAAIVLLSDGESNTGVDPLKAAALAASHGVRIYTVGMGTTDGITLGFDGWSMRVRLNEKLLKQIAITTQGSYYAAASTAELKAIYDSLATRLVLEKKRSTEITAVFVAAGTGLALLGALISMVRFNRIV